LKFVSVIGIKWHLRVIHVLYKFSRNIILWLSLDNGRGFLRFWDLYVICLCTLIFILFIC